MQVNERFFTVNSEIIETVIAKQIPDKTPSFVQYK